ncbi:hypothetical protein LPW26_15085 [Rhodopseudomonas sp. HC1]|uniref:hypothetical protein n=1 Tax=Rhodopseudomonas infernalis TaxID=2897386 RepID=UPI001EE946DF|nr:hypothetical protein [Rhodopseudomonas infernalis]MCG6205975.1 hypothetical protein [Rhodopseudomonas infernalis]
MKLGNVEIEYQGASEFLQADLIRILKELLELQKEFPAVEATASPANPTIDQLGKKNNETRVVHDHSTSTIATILAVSSGPELVKAAAAHIHFSKAGKTFSRQELIDAMRSAPAYFKETFINNLSSSLKRLTKDDVLRVVGNDSFSLSAKAIAEIEPKLA